MSQHNELIPTKTIENKILLLRNQQIILDSDLAELYGVTTKALNQAVKRNSERFPADFMFQLNIEEAMRSRSQSVTLKRGTNIKYLPYAFTEHGAVMAANVLRSERAVAASIYVVRAFIRLRQFLASHKELADKLAELERQVGTHDKAIVSLFQAIRKLMAPLPQKKKKAGLIH
ncbi:MAG: ORF6N domain-containing protein [bacterium]